MEGTKIEVGSTVRSHDFRDRLPGRPECYVEGVVEGILTIDGCKHYDILVIKRVWQGKEDAPVPADMHVYPLVNGTRLSGGGFTDGVELVSPVYHQEYTGKDGKPDCTFF